MATIYTIEPAGVVPDTNEKGAAMPADTQDARAATTEIVEKALAAGRPALDEATAKQVLAAYGVPVPRGGLVHSAPEAAELAASLGAPVAMKAIGALIQHKTELQLVALGLTVPEEVAATYDLLAQRAGDALEAVLVEEMVAGSREFMVGMKRDAAFGPVVAFGLGGTMTEVFRDIALAVSPGSEGDVAELPGLIRSKALLGAFRGQPAVDRDKLAAVLEAVARIAADHPGIAEIDVNPLLIRGADPIAADALMVLSPASSGPHRHRRRRSRRTSRPFWRRARSPSSAPPATSRAGAGPRSRTSSPAGSKAPSTR